MMTRHASGPLQELRSSEAVEMRFGPFQPGDRCNQYEIVAELGGGGYGCVYEARRELAPMIHGVIQPSDEFVALKCLQSRHAYDVAARERLNQEALLLKELKHESFVRFVDWGVTEVGVVFYVMELLEGKTLDAELGSGPMSVRRSLEVALQIAEGLAFAHDKRIVHRDLKPSNVFVTNRGKIKVLDLGAAKYEYGWISSNANDRPPCTVTYASPEQLLGEKADHRIDVFALGEILYKMLTGAHPFRSAGETHAEYAKSQLQCRAKPLADFGIASDVAAVVHRALAKRPEDRQSSMAEVLAELRRASSRLCCSACRVGEESDALPPHESGKKRASRPDELRATTVTVADPMKVFTNPTRPAIEAIGRAGLAELIQRCRLGSWQGQEKGPHVQRTGAVGTVSPDQHKFAKQLAWAAQATIVSRPDVRRCTTGDEPKEVVAARSKIRTSRQAKVRRALSAAAVVGFILAAEGLVVHGWRRAGDSRAAGVPTTVGIQRGLRVESTASSSDLLQDHDVVPQASSILAVSTPAQAVEMSNTQEVHTQRERALQRRSEVLAATRSNELGVIPLPLAPRTRSTLAPNQAAALAGIHVPKWDNLLSNGEHRTVGGGP